MFALCVYLLICSFLAKNHKTGIWDNEKNFKTAKCIKMFVLLFLIISPLSI